MKRKIKCEDCKHIREVDSIYKSYYCTADEDKAISLGVDYPPKRPPKSCPRLEKQPFRNTDHAS